MILNLEAVIADCIIGCRLIDSAKSDLKVLHPSRFGI